ncbi:MAG: ATP-binding cassette domain-containing protein [Candidatus Bathyarchaeales archaeon]
MAPIIRIVNLTKKFGEFTAVDHLNLEVEEGEILGILGPNGAGKTTTLLMLMTVIKPTEGTAFIGPYDVTREPDKARTLVGMAFQEPKLLWVDAPWDILNWHAKVCGLSAEERKKRVHWALEELQLWNERFKSVHAFSGGMRKRVEIAKILIQRPKIAIVDEPTAQIDIVGKHRIWNMLRELRDEGSTILLATNELYEADVLSDRVAIMHKGKLLVCDEPKKLKDSIPGGDVVEIALEKAVPSEAVEKLKGIQRVVNVLAIKEDYLKIYLNNAEEVLPKIMEFFMKMHVQIKSIRVSEPSLDDVFAHYTGLTIEEAQRK